MHGEMFLMKNFGRLLNSGFAVGSGASHVRVRAERVVLRNAPDVPAAVGEAKIYSRSK